MKIDNFINRAQSYNHFGKISRLCQQKSRMNIWKHYKVKGNLWFYKFPFAFFNVVVQ